MNKNIYSVEQLKEFLSTQPIGVEAVESITKFAQLQQNRIEWQTRRVNCAAEMLGHEQINEAMYD